MSEWIEHDGWNYPAPVGTRIAWLDAKGDTGEVVLRGHGADENGLLPNFEWSSWCWARLLSYARQGGIHLPINFCNRIIAYRIIDDGAEAERRAARKAMFDNMAKEALQRRIAKIKEAMKAAKVQQAGLRVLLSERGLHVGQSQMKHIMTAYYVPRDPRVLPTIEAVLVVAKAQQGRACA